MRNSEGGRPRVFAFLGGRWDGKRERRNEVVAAFMANPHLRTHPSAITKQFMTDARLTVLPVRPSRDGSYRGQHFCKRGVPRGGNSLRRSDAVSSAEHSRHDIKPSIHPAWRVSRLH